MNMQELWAENAALKKELSSTKSQLEVAEARCALLSQQKFKSKSEKHPGQTELDFDLNEAEVLVDQQTTDEELQVVPEHTRAKSKRQPKLIPDHLPRVEVHHSCDSAVCPCCNETMQPITPIEQEQLACLPSKFYVIKHVYEKLSCKCKAQAPIEAKRPKRAIPGSQISELALATWIEQKYDQGLPLYRLERIAKGANVEVARESLARWIIQVSKNYFQPLVNLMNDAVLSYDIVCVDETSLQVLREPGRAAESKSQLWIRRGGPPGQESIVLDYSPSRSAATCESLLSGFQGYVVSDAYAAYLKLGKQETIDNVLCSDHARRKFKEAYDTLDKKARKGSLADQALQRYGKLYKLEQDYKKADLSHRLQMREQQAKPLWDAFMAWAAKIQGQGVAHHKTAQAIAYLLKHKAGLQTYLQDARLPISNIAAEHVAKHVAVARKNFLFVCTPSGAQASANCFSVIQTAKLHGHHVHKYLAVILTELPKADNPDGFEQFLPWNISAEKVNELYQKLPLI